MADDLNINRFKVNDCILRLTEKNLSLPVARFDLLFALNAIPTAQVTPAFGIPVLRGMGNWATLQDIQERDAVDLILKVNGISTLLLRGYITQINTDDAASMFTRRQSLRLTVTHRAVKLGGTPSSSFVYANRAGASLSALSNHKVHVNMFYPGPDGEKSIYAMSSMVAWMEKKGKNIDMFPGNVLKEITKGLFKFYNDKQMTQEALDDMIKTYAPANLMHILPNTHAFLLHIANKYSAAWVSQNAWQALVATANDLFLQIVPFNTGFYISNPYALNRNPSRIIKAREYSKVGQTLDASLKEPIDGVILLPPDGSKARKAIGKGFLDGIFTFPSIKSGDEVLLNKYYHYRNYPAWIQHVVDDQNGALSGKYFSPPKNTILPQDAATLAEYYEKVGANLARAYYGKMRQETRSSEMVFPYRLDLMPGTNIQFDDSDLGISFIGDTTHGMVERTLITCDALSENPMLTTTIKVSALRNAKDNADDKLTFDGHPVFEEQWVGIWIDGTLLKKKPKSKKIGAPVNRQFVAPKGVEIDVDVEHDIAQLAGQRGERATVDIENAADLMDDLMEQYYPDQETPIGFPAGGPNPQESMKELELRLEKEAKEAKEAEEAEEEQPPSCPRECENLRS
jgi:hypothetical protein